MIADYTDTSISPWHPFKKFRHVQYKSRSCTHKQSFPPPHYCARGHCNATDESRITTRRFYLLSPPTKCLAGRRDCQHECPIDSFRTLCIIFWHAALSLYHNNTLRSNDCKFRWATSFLHKTWIIIQTLRGPSYRFRTLYTSTYLITNVWLTVALYPY